MDATGASEDALAAKVDELAQVCARLIRENAELRQEITGVRAGSDGGARARLELPVAGPARPLTGRISRRMMGRAVGAAAVSAVGAAALADLGAQPAAAATGDAVIAGNTTRAGSRTAVLYDGASHFGGVVLLGNDSAYDGGNAAFPAALGGWAGAGSSAGRGGVPNGIYGFTDNGAGNGVVGVNSNAVSGTGSGVFGAAASPGGAGVKGTNSAGPGVLGTCSSTGGSASAIIGIITSSTPAAGSAGVRGQNNDTGAVGVGVWGNTDGSGWGVLGTSKGGIGVNGVCSSGTGVSGDGDIGVSAVGGTAVQATARGSGQGVLATNTSDTLATIRATNNGRNSGIHATSQGRGGVFGGTAAQIQLTPGSGATHPKGGSRGDLYADKTGRLWFCKKGGTTATWHQLA